MIKISDLNGFLSLVKKIGIEVTSELNSIVECIRIKQIDSATTELTTIEPNAGVFTRLYVEEDKDSFGIVNTEFLVNYKHLLDTLSSLTSGKATHCWLVIEDGKLLAYTNAKPKPGCNGIGLFDENYTYSDVKTIELYLGDEDDFLFPEFTTEENIGYMKGDNLNISSELLIKLGQFTGSDEKYINTIESGGRGIEFHFTSNSLSIFSIDKTRMVMLHITNNFSGLDDLDWLTYLEGRNLYRLIDLAKSSEFIDVFRLDLDGNKWIGFESSKGLVYVRLKEEDYSVSYKHKQYDELKLMTQKELVEFESYVIVNGIELINAITKQHSEKEKLLEKLTITEEDAQLIVFPFHKAAQKDRSIVKIEDFEGEFISTNLDYKFIDSVLQSLAKYTTVKNLGPLIKITQYPYVLNELNIVLLYFTPLNSDSSSSIELFCTGDYAELQLMEELSNGQEI